MGKLYAIGEALIDIIETEEGKSSFLGGAVANVACCVSSLFGQAEILTCVGDDSFGKQVLNTLKQNDVGLNYSRVLKDKATMSTLVKLDSEKNRSFTFNRDNTADLFYLSKYLPKQIESDDIIYFGSLAYAGKTKRAINKLIRHAKQKKALCSFDVNVRKNICKNPKQLKRNINKLIKKADILKISDDEIPFVTGKSIEEGTEILRKQVRLLLITKGEYGSSAYVKDKTWNAKAVNVTVVDTTGAGDAYMGAVLSMLLKSPKPIEEKDFSKVLQTASLISSKVVSSYGAISAYQQIKKARLI